MSTTESSTETTGPDEIVTRNRHQSGVPVDGEVTATPTETETEPVTEPVTEPTKNRHQSSEPVN